MAKKKEAPKQAESSVENIAEPKEAENGAGNIGHPAENFDEIRAISDWAREMRLASWQVAGVCHMQKKCEEEKVSKNELLQHLSALEHRGLIGG